MQFPGPISKASRFVIEGNALFGQWSWNKGSGIVPIERDVAETYEIKAFESLSDSVASYMKNLNTNKNYLNFNNLEIILDQAIELNKDNDGKNIGDEVLQPLPSFDFGRIAAQEISVVDFDHNDVVRHPLVSKIVKAY